MKFITNVDSAVDDLDRNDVQSARYSLVSALAGIAPLMQVAFPKTFADQFHKCILAMAHEMTQTPPVKPDSLPDTVIKLFEAREAGMVTAEEWQEVQAAMKRLGIDVQFTPQETEQK